MIFPPPSVTPALRARWESKMRRAAGIWQRAFEREDWTLLEHARRVCYALRDQRDALTSPQTESTPR